MENRVLNIRVAGVMFEGRQVYLAQMTGREPCRLQPELDNPYDPNAIAVMVAPLKSNDHYYPHDPANHYGAMPEEITQNVIWKVGYIPKEMAKEIAPYLDGEALMCEIAELTGGFELRDGGTAALGLRLRVELPGFE